MTSVSDPICNFCRSSSKHIILGDVIIWKDLTVHTNCLYTASGLVQKIDPQNLSNNMKKNYVAGFDPKQVMAELQRGKRLRCRCCGKSGACIGCSNVKCKYTFHLPCLFKADGFAIFRGSFPAFCVHHRPTQDIESRLLCYSEPPDCCICLFSIAGEDTDKAANEHNENNSGCLQNSLRLSTSPILSNHSPVNKTPHSVNNTRKRVTIVEGYSPLTPAPSPSRTRKSSSVWEINSLPLDESPKSLTKSVTTETNQPRWLSKCFSTPVTNKKSTLLKQPIVSAFQKWSHSIIHGMCCPSSWMHRECITGYARSAGLHHVKCPLCFNRDTFIENLLQYGVWIPDRDASWELEPGAFAYSQEPSSLTLTVSDQETPNTTLMAENTTAEICTNNSESVESELHNSSANLNNFNGNCENLTRLRRRRAISFTPKRVSQNGKSKNRQQNHLVNVVQDSHQPLSPLIEYSLNHEEVEPLKTTENIPPRSSTESIHSVLKFTNKLTPPVVRRRRRYSSAAYKLKITNLPSVVKPLRRNRRQTSFCQLEKKKNLDEVESSQNMRQTFISSFFKNPTSARIEATNELFRTMLTESGKSGGRYSLRSSDMTSTSQLYTPHSPKSSFQHV